MKKNKKGKLDILFEDKHILIVNKKGGLPTIKSENCKDNLYSQVFDYLHKKNQRVFVVHRLDKDTSGIVVLAKDEKTKNKLQENWNEYVSLREYVAVVHGHLKNESDTIVQKLKETKTNLVYPTKDEDGKEAITKYKVIKESEDYSMVSINIETGRKNQIRVAFQTLRNPIVGDKKYGDPRDKETRLYLHANRLKLYYPELKKDILFETPTPNEFKKIMN